MTSHRRCLKDGPGSWRLIAAGALAGCAFLTRETAIFLVLLLNQEFMALMVLAVPTTWWLCFGRSVEPRLRGFARLMTLFAVVWFVCVGAAQSLLPLNPRYFMITSSMACLLTGLALGKLIGEASGARRLAGWGALVVLIGGSPVGLSVENRGAGVRRDRIGEARRRSPGRTPPHRPDDPLPRRSAAGVGGGGWPGVRRAAPAG